MNKKIAFGLALASIVMFGSCKPKQSAYKSAYEKAKEKEMEQTHTEEPSTIVVETPKVETQEVVRKEKVTPVYASDASNLKAYNVVVAAMGMKPNAESLKERLENAGYKVILAQNEKGMFRVIIASCDTKDQASVRKNSILDEFMAESDLPTLKAQYGIPFDDWWILERTY